MGTVIEVNDNVKWISYGVKMADGSQLLLPHYAVDLVPNGILKITREQASQLIGADLELIV